MKPTRHIAVALVAASAFAAAGGVASAQHRHGHHRTAERLIPLAPDPAANPEGIAFDKRTRAFLVSSTGDGAIYRGTPRGQTAVPYITGAAGRSAVGLKVRHGKLYVAGGSTGAISVYDLASKALLASFATGSGGFLNDLVVTSRGDVYVTDSTRPTLWHVTADQVKAGTGAPQALDVSSGIPFQTGFNLNGIVADGSRRLIVVQSNTGKLFRVELGSHGTAIKDIDEVQGVSVPGGDGMLLDGGRLVVVQGGPPARLSFVKLRHGDRRGEVRATRTSPLLKGPSTIARAEDAYLVVNADFATSTKPFTVAVLRRDKRAHDKGDDKHEHGDNHDAGDDRGDDGDNHDAGDDQGDDNGAGADATPTPYYGAGGDDHGGGHGGDDGGHGGHGGDDGPSAGPTPYYGGGHS